MIHTYLLGVQAMLLPPNLDHIHLLVFVAHVAVNYTKCFVNLLFIAFLLIDIYVFMYLLIHQYFPLYTHLLIILFFFKLLSYFSVTYS